MSAVRRSYPVPVEILLLGAVVLVWQLARIPFESSLADAVAASRDWLAAEKDLGIAIEPDVIRWTYARPDLLARLNWFYSHMDETLAFGILIALRMVDPVRYPPVRTAFALAHVPALVVVALYPAAPPRWVPDIPHGQLPAADFTGDWRNSTAAAVSLHVGIPALLSVAAIWMRPRAPLAWASLLYPLTVFAVVVGTANHFVLDAVVGIACAAIGVVCARLIHGEVPRGTPDAPPATIAAVAVLVAAAAYAVNEIVLRLQG
jgi:PAP2 superfamily